MGLGTWFDVVDDVVCTPCAGNGSVMVYGLEGGDRATPLATLESGKPVTSMRAAWGVRGEQMASGERLPEARSH